MGKIYLEQIHFMHVAGKNDVFSRKKVSVYRILEWGIMITSLTILLLPPLIYMAGEEWELVLLLTSLSTPAIMGPLAQMFTQFPAHREEEDRFLFARRHIDFLFERKVYGIIPFSEVAQVQNVIDRKKKRTAYVSVSLMNGDTIYLVERENALGFIYALEKRKMEGRIVTVEREIGRMEWLKIQFRGGRTEHRKYVV